MDISFCVLFYLIAVAGAEAGAVAVAEAGAVAVAGAGASERAQINYPLFNYILFHSLTASIDLIAS